MEFITEKSREKIHEVQDGAEQREDIWSSERSKAERRYREFKTEESREKIQEVQDGTEQRVDT